LQWLKQLQDPVPLELILAAALAELELDLLLFLDPPQRATQGLVEAPPAGQSQCLLGLHQPAVLMLDQRL
jgi:hypothetical protein